ncbi:hypothetical protein [Porphyromonas uenonis]|uniref:hypothetical protein n=1 Tax=Porphyromonas uenonis TaxID=281920 RepID=UPI0026ED8AA3|nr:hypothetical protein [Porphyromonas uenonis]
MKKVFVLVAAIAALSLVSCNKENQNQDAQNAEQNIENAQEATPEVAPEVAPEATPAEGEAAQAPAEGETTENAPSTTEPAK